MARPSLHHWISWVHLYLKILNRVRGKLFIDYMIVRCLLFTFILMACSHDKKMAAQNNRLSVLVFTDSLILYTGKLEKDTRYTKINVDKRQLTDIANDYQKKITDLEVSLKISGGPG